MNFVSFRYLEDEQGNSVMLNKAHTMYKTTWARDTNKKAMTQLYCKLPKMAIA